MTNKDLFKILLCTFGYDRNIKIDTFRREYGSMVYAITAENKDGDVFSECNSEGVLFNVYTIIEYMKDNNVGCDSKWWGYSLKHILVDSERDKILKQWDINDEKNQRQTDRLSPLWEWTKKNDPCPNCNINQKESWDIVHYNCELCHTHSCEILLDFEKEFERRKTELLMR